MAAAVNRVARRVPVNCIGDLVSNFFPLLTYKRWEIVSEYTSHKTDVSDKEEFIESVPH